MPFRFLLSINKCGHHILRSVYCWVFIGSVVGVIVGVGGVVDADGDGERAAGADPAAVESAGRVEAPRDGADYEHEGAARADQGPRVGTPLSLPSALRIFTTSYQYILRPFTTSVQITYFYDTCMFNPLYGLLRHLLNPST